MRLTSEEAINKLITKSANKFEHEIYLIRRGRLEYVHHNNNSIQFKSSVPPKQTTGKDVNEAKHWYRCMSQSDFLYLKRRDVLLGGDSYGGIATNFDYASSYFSDTNSHIVEFETIADAPLLYHTFLGLNTGKGTPASPKGEGDGGTFGLGKTGYLGGKAGDKFNELLERTQITWRLVACKLPLPA